MIKAAYKSVSGMQGAGDGVRDVVAITGKAGNEDNAHAGVRKKRANCCRRRCKDEQGMSASDPGNLRGGVCDQLRLLNGTRRSF